MNKKRFITWFCTIFLSIPLFSWQDEIDVYLRSPSLHFKNGSYGFFSSASSEVRLGRYLFGDAHHAWRGGLMGDVALFNFNNKVIWHASINTETLADDKNPINFRLVHVYYQAYSGLKWRFKNSVFNFGYKHRCSHGADTALNSRILIRSGLYSSLALKTKTPFIDFILKPEINLYIFGQNSDLKNQGRASAMISGQMSWPIVFPFFMFISGGYGIETKTKGKKYLYFINHSLSNLKITHLAGFRIGLAMQNESVQNHISLHMAKNSDSGLGYEANEGINLSFDINFFW